MPTVDAPDWFRESLAARPERSSVEVEGCSIAYRAWGDRGEPGLVLVHGGGAHSGWWDHVAPMLADGYRVAAIDLSGHGDSGRREVYSTEAWAEEILAVAQAAGMSGSPLVIGHSMGGWATFTVGARHSDHVAGIVVIDSTVTQDQPEEQAAEQRTAFGPLRRYPTREDALEHFRTVPEQPTSLPYVLEHIAEESIRPYECGWAWKFDPAVFFRGRPGPDTLRAITCRVALFRAEFGIVTPDIKADMYNALGRRAPVVDIPRAWHHVMLDQPLSLVTGLRTILADWDHSDPRARTMG